MEGWQTLQAYLQFLSFGKACLIGALICMYFKLSKTRNYFVCLFAFIFIYSFLWPLIKASDPDKLFRYLANCISQFLFVLTLYFLNSKNKLNTSTLVSASIISCVIIFCQLYRVVDRHIYNLPYAHKLIVDVVQVMNCALVLVGFISLLVDKYYSGREKNRGRNRSDSRDSSFDARIGRDIQKN